MDEKVLIEAIKTGKLVEVEKLFADNYNCPKFDIDERQENMTPLHKALELGYGDIAKYLGASLVKPKFCIHFVANSFSLLLAIILNSSKKFF